MQSALFQVLHKLSVLQSVQFNASSADDSDALSVPGSNNRGGTLDSLESMLQK